MAPQPCHEQPYLKSNAAYRFEFSNGQRFDIGANDSPERHDIAAGMGYHGYRNNGGSLSEEHASLESDRLLADPDNDA